ncbi:MAG: DedA family protein [Nitrospirae bacterium]|jgi:membrane protein DedA with SNARE-associated domain|nr:DedA family protein [Nitrospirota bacterium]
MYSFLNFLVETIGSLGYPGIVILMFIESTFIPFPSEFIIPPAGYLISKNQMTWTGVILSGTAGSVMGALFNYAIAVYLGRPFILRYGKYFGITEKKFRKGELFYLKHGNISTFIGRLILGVRQYISFPAGLARMNLKKFCFYTALGAGIWVWILAYIGFFAGNNKEMILDMSRQWSIYLIIGCALLVIVYILWHKRKQKTMA